MSRGEPAGGEPDLLLGATPSGATPSGAPGVNRDLEDSCLLDANAKNMALIRASANGKLECVSRLLEAGANINSQDVDGDTPLTLSSLNNYIDVVRLLIDRGCDINITGDNNRTALHMAVWGRRLEIVRLLIEAGCDTTIRDRYNDNAIMLCVRRGHADIIKELFMVKCDVNARSNEQETALHYAARYGQISCAKVLVNNSEVDKEALNIWKVTPFLYALMHGNGDVALELMEAGCDINAKGPSKKTAMHYAVNAQQGHCVRALLLNGASPMTQDADSRDPLMCAVEKNLPGMVKILIQAGVPLDTRGKATVQQKREEFALFEVAVFKGFLDVAQMLYHAGAPVGDLCNLKCDRYKTLGVVIRNVLVGDWLSEVVHSPRPLSDLVRTSIWKIIPPGVAEKINSLPLPGTVKQYLAFEDFGFYPERPEVEPKRVFSLMVL